MISFVIFSIKFFVSIGFFGIVTLMLFIDKTGLMLPTVIAIISHETGHIIAMSFFKSKPESVTLKVGTVGISGRFFLNAKNEIIMLLAGSLFNIILFFMFFLLYLFLGRIIILNFALVMLVTGAFNILPVIGLDGGEILKIALGRYFKVSVVNVVLTGVSLITILFIISLGFFVLADTKSNISLILMALYLFLGILLSKKQKNYCKIHPNIVK